MLKRQRSPSFHPEPVLSQQATRPPPSAPPSGSRGTDLGLLSLALIWGLNFPVVKLALEELHPLAFNALRFPLAAGVLFLLVRPFSHRATPIRGEDWPRIVALGIVGNVVYQFFFIFGLDATLAGNAAILLATTPVWTTLLSTAAGHESPPLSLWVGVAATVVGMILVVAGGSRSLQIGQETLVGDLMMIGAAIIWSVYTVGGRPLTRRYGALRVTGWTLWIGTVGLVALGIPALADTPWERISTGTWLAVAYAGVFALGIAYSLWYHGVRQLGSSRTAVYSNLVPVVALVVAWLWLGEVPTPPQIGGAVLILASLTLTRLGRRRPS